MMESFRELFETRLNKQVNEGINDPATPAQLDFIKKNLSVLPAHEQTKLYRDIVADKFKQETGLYMTVNAGQFIVNTVGFKHDMNDSYANVLKAFNSFKKGAEKQGGVPMDVVSHFKFMKDTYYMRFDRASKTITAGYEYSMRGILDLIIYVRTKKLQPDMSYASSIIEKNGWTSSSYPRGEEIKGVPALKGVKMTRMKNGKWKFVGLTEAEWDYIGKIYTAIGGK